tara:strand:- start:109 stop:459 length:351 start_codon:yes stop_codon:yes gene_type:complete
MNKELTIEDIKNMLRGKMGQSMVYVDGKDDPLYRTMKDMVVKIWPDTENNMYEVSGGIRRMFDTFRHMEAHDQLKIVNTIKKYEVKGTNGGINGDRTYGYDVSRVDRKLIRRRRAN